VCLLRLVALLRPAFSSLRRLTMGDKQPSAAPTRKPIRPVRSTKLGEVRRENKHIMPRSERFQTALEEWAKRRVEEAVAAAV
jgi:hypothetical protein